jgi:indolepyruvate ferredoxin oxidoreductase beta subunit
VGEPFDRPLRLVIAGVGGQGTLTLAQIVMEVARRAGRFVLQSELHGMSQRGGAVHACLTIASSAVSTPVIMEGTGDLLIALEPLEAVRYVPLLRRDAPMLVARDPIKTVEGYPPEEQLWASLEAVAGCELVATETLTRAFRFKQAVGMVLLGRAAARLPFPLALWEEVIAERLASKGQAAIERNLRAFAHGLEGATIAAGPAHPGAR